MENKQVQQVRQDRKASPFRLPLILYAAVWVLCVAWFWLGMDGGGWIMAYTILTHWVMLPLVSLAAGFLVARRTEVQTREQRAGLLAGTAVLLGLANLGAVAVTFVLGTALHSVNIAPLEWEECLIFFFPGAVGLGAGSLFHWRNWGAKAAVAVLLGILAVVWVLLKSLGGFILRPLPILDLPALVILAAGIWFLLRKQASRRG